MEDMMEKILDEVSTCVRSVSKESLAQARDLIEARHRIFVAGAGRSGLCMRALGMRLMHIGKVAYVVGETTTPSVRAMDLLIIGSGSGRTKSLIGMATEAKRLGARILLFTTDPASPLAEMADQRVVIPAISYRVVDEKQRQNTVQPLGTLFEQSLFLVCDYLVLGLMQCNDVNVSEMAERHANLE